MTDKEIWKDILGYEDFYQISSLGRIRSKQRAFKREKYIHIYKSKILYLVKQKNHDYLTIRLNNSILTKGYLVHRLVAIAFIPNPEKKKEVNHIDGNKRNNNMSNLEWCTAKENIRHSFKMGLHKSRIGSLNKNAKLSEIDVVNIKKMINSGIKNSKISGLFPVSAAAISNIKTGRIWSHIKV